VRQEAGLGAMRLHDLRHSFASRAAAMSETLPMIGKLLGHSSVKSTARYAHLDDADAVEAAQRIGDLIASLLGNPEHEDYPVNS
jgi:integrase